jgi:phospholipid/cholesterol/gamma-HCH transport system substrate-binding protein
MVVRSSAHLHDGASARLRGTTPLGELYVDLTDGTSPTVLPDGATLSEGTVAPTIEDTMATTSVFLNGGGITELSTIVRESNLALGGREATARDVLQRIDRTTGELNASMDDIDAALRSLSGLSVTLRERRSSIRAALDEVAPTARALRAQIEDLATLLSHVEKFGKTTSSVIAVIQDDLVRSIRQMGPIFDQMNAIEGDLTPAIEDLVRFARLLDEATPTQYLNTDLHIHLNQVPSLATSMQSELTPRAQADKSPSSGPITVKPPKITVPAVPQVQRLVDPKPLIDQLNRLLQGAKR